MFTTKAAPTVIFPLRGQFVAITRTADGEKRRRRRGERRMKGNREGEWRGSGGVGGEERRIYYIYYHSGYLPVSFHSGASAWPPPGLWGSEAPSADNWIKLIY